MMTVTNEEVRLPAIEIKQGSTRKFYSFAIDGKLLPRFATISRIRRDTGNELIGYQRPEVLSHIAAIRDAQVSHFPICATAFIAESEIEQREQFILVNSTKPLPKGLIYELLPETETELPTLLQRRKFPARLLTTLNSDTDSPLKGK